MVVCMWTSVCGITSVFMFDTTVYGFILDVRDRIGFVIIRYRSLLYY